MSRHEFIGHLREALSGEIPDSVIEENVRFYNRYIDDERSKGRSEEDIFSELGDPRLLAKTITETWQSDDTSLDDDGQGYDQSYGRDYDTYGNTYEEDGSRSRERGFGGSYVNVNGRDINMNKWYMKAIPIIILLLIVAFVLWVAFGFLRLTVAILASPAFWAVILVFVVIGFFSRRR